MTRNEAREQAFTLLFSECFHSEQSAKELIENAGEAQDYEPNAYTERLLGGVKEHKAQIDEEISSKLTSSWRIERLPKTTLAILRLAVFEEVNCNLREECIRKNIFRLLFPLSTFLLELRKFGL